MKRIWSFPNNGTPTIRYFDTQTSQSYSLYVTTQQRQQMDNPANGWQIYDIDLQIWRSLIGHLEPIFFNVPIHTVVHEKCDGTTFKTYKVDNHTWPNPDLDVVDVVDYPNCGFIINDITIIDLLVLENETNYTVTVIAQSYNGVTGYSCINPTPAFIQVSNVFTLPPGDYIFYAIDALGFIAQRALHLPEIAAYNPRWSFVFKDYEGNQHNCYIFELGYEGAVNVLSHVGATPMRIRYGKGGGEDIGNPILGSECVLQLESQTDREFIDLTSNNPERFKFEHYINNVLNWSGNIATDVYSESYTTPPYSVSVTFRDGLAELKDVDFLQENGDFYDGILSEFFIIKQALKRTKLRIPINTFVNLFEQEISTSEDPLTQIYLRADAFYSEDGKPDSFYDVLKSILEKYYCRIFQANGKWNVININEYTSSYDRIRYDKNGYILGTENFNPVLNITPPTILEDIIQWSNNDQSLNPVPAYSQIKLIFNIRQFGNIIRNGEFTQIDDIGFKYWTDIFGILRKESTFTNGKNKTIAVIDGDATNESTDQYISANEKELVDISSGISFIFKSKFKLIPVSPNPVNYFVKFRLKIGPYFFDNTTNLWSTTESFIIFNQNDFSIDDFSEVEIKTPPISINEGTVDLRIYQAAATSFGDDIEKMIIDSISVNIVGNTDPIPDSEEIIQQNSNGAQNTKLEKTIKWGDLNQYSNPSIRIVNVMYNTSDILFNADNITSAWKRGGTDDEYLPLLTLLSDYYMVQYQSSSNKLNGKLYSQFILSMCNSFVDPNMSDAPFMPVSMDIDYKKCEYGIEMVQLKNYSDERLNFRLLETGEKRLLQNSGFSGIESSRLLEDN